MSQSQITNKIVAQIKAMKARGDLNHDIAAWFGINQGIISRICGKNKDPQYAQIRPEKDDIPPPGPYEFGGNGISHLYRTITEARNHWENGEVQLARAKFERLYRSLGRPSNIDQIEEIFAEQLFDERGCRIDP